VLTCQDARNCTECFVRCVMLTAEHVVVHYLLMVLACLQAVGLSHGCGWCGSHNNNGTCYPCRNDSSAFNCHAPATCDHKNWCARVSAQLTSCVSGSHAHTTTHAHITGRVESALTRQIRWR
jgi:hypothetical protein